MEQAEGQEKPLKGDYIYISFERDMRLLGSARCVKTFQKQKRTSKLIMAEVQNTRVGGSDRGGGS